MKVFDIRALVKLRNFEELITVDINRLVSVYIVCILHKLVYIMCKSRVIPLCKTLDKVNEI